MSYIKKLVLKGFKSFPKETEIPFVNSMNSIVGPNGSGKSNLTDSICFVLGRLSSKSMRAEKTSNLIFAGTKELKPAGEASVKLVFDNSGKKFSHPSNEITIGRTARRNGQSIYRINNEVKTRQEVLELLASAGIDPYGFNIILQGEINSMVKMHSEERRNILEEVAGISIYETRKEKSLRELEKTDEKLKEVSAILRERKAYLRNLEEERKQALKFKDLESTAKKLKASILKRKTEEKEKEIKKIEEEIARNQASKGKERAELEKIQHEINSLEEEINKISSYMQKASGIEQEKINEEVSDLRAELASLSVKRDSTETRLQEILSRRQRGEEEIESLEAEISEMRKKSPLQAKKYKELEEKKKKLAEIEKEKKELYNLKEKLNSIKALVNEKDKRLQRVKNESDFILKESEKISEELYYKDAALCQEAILEMKKSLQSSMEKYGKSEKEKLDCEKKLSVFNSEVSSFENIKSQVSKIDICPLCKSKITPSHVHDVSKECDNKISELKKGQAKNQENLEIANSEILKIKIKLEELQKEIPKAEINLVKLKNFEEKKLQIKNLFLDEKALENEKKELEKNKTALENKLLQARNIEEIYDKILFEIQQVSSRTEENIDLELELKERDLERTKLIIKQSFRDEEDLTFELKEFSQIIDEKENLLEVKEKEEAMLKEKFRKSIERKDSLQIRLKEKSSLLNERQLAISGIDNTINNIKIEKARFDAEHENLEIDFQAYKDELVIQGSINFLQEKLEKTEKELGSIGSVNLRALEVYDSIKKEYDEVENKTLRLETEKTEILKIIEEIDKKKRRTFMKTLVSINELFARNFSQLSAKGQAFLELENSEEPFSGGLNITIRVGKGKYFDVTGLSGGEQTLVALSLIFAIQEYKPYSFYIFDEVDAALDKRNSEKLAVLIKRYMKTGQYLIVTHNDALITESNVLYGVSMQEGVSKVISLEI